MLINVCYFLSSVPSHCGGKGYIVVELELIIGFLCLVFTKYVHAQWNKPAKWGKWGFSWCLQITQKQVSPNWVFRWGQGSHRDNFPYLDTGVDVLVRSVSCIFPSHLLLDGLAPSGRAVMCRMGHLRQNKGENWAENMSRMRHRRRREQSEPTHVSLGDPCFSTATS